MPRSRLKVLFLVESLSGGGAEKILSGLVRGLDRERFDVTVCTVVDCGPYREEVRKYAHYRTIVGGRGWLYRLKYALVYRFLPAGWIYQWRIAGDYDVEVAFTEGLPTRLLAAAPEGKARRIAWVHVDLEARPWTQGPVYQSLKEERKAYTRFQTVVHVSQTVREAFERRFGAHPGSRVLHNPVDSDEVRSGVAAAVEVPEKKHFRIVSVGRLEDQKGFDRLIAVLGRLKERGWPAELVILGEGSRRRELEGQAAALGVADSVLMPGFRENPYPWMASADLFVCSSRSEGMSTVVTEALVLGVPVLSVECSGVHEQLGMGRFGRMVENDDEALLSGLEDFLSGRESCAVWRERAALGGREVSYGSAIRKVEHLLEGAE
ncbi:glycosyltransferase [uncultured Akkermansia sp.]|uniref:glycosyltransferase n=1 Tax=uncultured Akkermansia sp. TaxID=512294 RepID=UPI00265D2FA5|nr:glycosyltransferase [uncultured Akkermansia sp.]